MAILEKESKPIEHHLSGTVHLRGGEQVEHHALHLGGGSTPVEKAVVPDVFRQWKDINEMRDLNINTPTLLRTSLEISRSARNDNRLVDAGFFTENELISFLESFNQELSEGKTPTEAVGAPLWGMVANIRSYLLEYAEQALVLPHLVKLSSRGEMVNLNGAPIQIDPTERQGAYLEAKWKVQQFMAKALDGSLAVMTSPPGITGKVDKEGRPISFQNTQTIIFWKEQGKLQGITLVTDMTKGQNRELLRELGAPTGFHTDELSELSDIVRNPALLGPNRGQSLQGVINKILSIRGYSDIRIINNKGEVEFRPVSEIFRDLARREELLKFNEVAEKCIEQFENFVISNAGNLNNSFIRRRLSEEIEGTILRATRTILREKNGLASDYSELRFLSRGDYFGEELQHLKSWAGCSINSSSSMRALRGFPSLGISIDSFGSISKTCKICGVKEAEAGGCGFCHDCEGQAG